MALLSFSVIIERPETREYRFIARYYSHEGIADVCLRICGKYANMIDKFYVAIKLYFFSMAI